MKKLYLVDVSSMYFRAFYAIRALSNPAGMPTNALYGFLSMTIKLLRDIHPDYMAYCFDRKEPSFRKEIDPNYKAHRAEMPEDLVPQVPYVRTLTEALGIACYDMLGFEADDVIGSLTKFGRDHGLEVVIVSGDKDFAQLIRPYVTMYDTMKDIRYDEAGALEKWGVDPKQMIDFLAICGDSSDNIPGVAGIGPKGAQKLLADFGSLEGVYKNIEKVSSASVKQKLITSQDNAFLSQRLVKIVCDMPLKVTLDDLKMKPIVREKLHALLAELDFKTFAKTLLGDSPAGAATSSASAAAPAGAGVEHVTGSASHVLNPEGKQGATGNPFVRAAPVSTASAPVVPAIEIGTQDFGPVTEERLSLAELEKWLKPGEETWALHTERASYLAQRDKRGFTIAELAADGRELGAMLSRKNLLYKGFHLKDFAKRHYVQNPKVDWDQMLAAYVIRAGNIDNPQALFSLYNGVPLPELPSPTQILNAHLRLETQLRKKLTSINGDKVLFEIEQPLVPILLEMENAGILIDLKALKHQSEGLTRDLAVLEKEIHAEAGEAFNIGSPKQLGRILFEKMKMPTGKKTKTGYSTDSDVLEKLAVEYPFVNKLLQWRELSKLKSTYVDALPMMADKETARVHTTFNQALAATGRLSSINPNLQNIPIRTERGNEVRKAFIADPGSSLISADYSQIELRILAHITNDEGLIRAFESGADIHAATASEVFEVPLKEVTGEMRRKAKAVNFGLAYGQAAFGLAETLRIPRGEATTIINRYFERFPGVKTYMTDTVEEAKKKGYVETILGRRRYLDELYSGSAAVRKFGERAAINAPIQGTASDLVKLAMIKVGAAKDAKMLLQVHDELVLEVPDGDVKRISQEVAQKMENVASLRVPLSVNTGSGKNWNAAHS